MLSQRFKASSELFYNNPQGYIRSLLGPEINNMTYEVQSVILPKAEILVDVHYNKLQSPSLKTMYVKIDELKHLNSQNNSFVFERDGIPICLMASAARFKNAKSIPVIVYPFNNTDKFYKYIARVRKEPLHAFSTIVGNKFGFNDVQPKLEKIDDPVSSEQKNENKREMYTIEETIEAYKSEIANFADFSYVSVVKPVKKWEETKNVSSDIAFVIDYRCLPDEGFNGHVIIIEHRRSDLLFYYPHTANLIDSDQVKFIKNFMKFDQTNLPPE